MILSSKNNHNQKKWKADSRRWTQKEETELARALVDILEDINKGNGQSLDQFWLRVTERFCIGMGQDPDYRASDQCNSK